MKKCVSVFLAALMLSLVSCSENPNTEGGTDVGTDTAYIQGKSGNKYTVDDEYTLSVPTYKYVFSQMMIKKKQARVTSLLTWSIKTLKQNLSFLKTEYQVKLYIRINMNMI